MKSLIVAMTVLAIGAAPAIAQDKVTLRLATVFDANGQEAWQPVLDDFAKSHPNIEVKMEATAGSGAAVYPDVLRTAMASGDPPDVFFMWGGSQSEPFIKADQVRPIDDDYAKYDWGKKFPQWIVDRLKFDGKSYGVPLHGQGMGFFYRTDIIKDHNLSLPKTYAELESFCETLAKDNIACASTGGKYGWHVMRLVDYFLEGTCGPQVHDDLNHLTASWDQPCVVAAYQRLKDWTDKKWLVPNYLNVDPTDARIPVYQGNAAMIMEGPWFEATLAADQQDESNWDFFLPPTDHAPDRYSAFPEQWMIAKGSKHPDEAATFIDYISTVDVQKAHPEAFQGSPLIGNTPDCSKVPLTCKIVEIVQSDRPAYPPTDQAFVKELMDSYFEVQDGIVAGKISPADGAKLMQQRAEAWKAKQPA
ncbi:MAG TPA: ABC transporter substrate-binding protein [Devosiaceae bacterium]|jgi:raffinose/stachyose/melibiose transport system substrate-binding protein|nr:ABC transporter substrate-binding protein [Devosiaceae bacterium]